MNTCKSLFSKFSFFDILTLSSNLRLSLKTTKNQKTFIGQFFTFCIGIVCILSFVYFSNNMIYKLNPYCSISEMSTTNPDFYPLTKDSFFLLFGVTNLANTSTVGYFIDDTLFQVSAVLRVKNGANFEDVPFNIGPCEIDDFPNDPSIRNKYLSNVQGEMFCIKNYSMGLVGRFNSLEYNALILTMETCQNTSQESNCQSPELIEQIINQLRVKIFYTDIALDPFNYDNPIQQFVDDFYGILSYRLQTWIQMRFQHVDISTDDGFLLESESEISGLKQNSIYYMNSVVIGGPIFIIDVNLENSKNILTRKYDKIQDVLAQVGGAMKFFIICAHLVSYFSIQMNIVQKLGNKVFIYISQNKNLQKTPSSENMQKSFNEIAKTEQKINLNLGTLSYVGAHLDQKNDYLRLGHMRKLYDYTNRYLEKVLEVSFLVRKLLEIDKLKSIIFDKEQLFLFNKLNRPIIYVDRGGRVRSNMVEIEEDSWEYSVNEKKIQAVSDRLLNRECKSEIDERILEKINDEFFKVNEMTMIIRSDSKNIINEV